MAVYEETKTNTWRAVYRYTDWMGEKKQTQKRGFATKRDALAWEREQLNKVTADLDMTFGSFVDSEWICRYSRACPDSRARLSFLPKLHHSCQARPQNQKVSGFLM